MDLILHICWPALTARTDKLRQSVSDALTQCSPLCDFMSVRPSGIHVCGMFCERNRMPDVDRYRLVHEGDGLKLQCHGHSDFRKSPYNDKRPRAAEPEQKTLLILLESPHDDEYCPTMCPRAPACGSAGRGIATNLARILNCSSSVARCINDGTRVIIANPVPFQASLKAIHGQPLTSSSFRTLRNTVWKLLWNVPEMRCAFREKVQCYNPTWIVNACTGNWKGLKGDLYDWLFEIGMESRLYAAPHPSFNRWNYCARLEKIKPLDINAASESSLESTLKGVGSKRAQMIVEGRPDDGYAGDDDLVGAGVPQNVVDSNRFRMAFVRPQTERCEY